VRRHAIWTAFGLALALVGCSASHEPASTPLTLSDPLNEVRAALNEHRCDDAIAAADRLLAEAPPGSVRAAKCQSFLAAGHACRAADESRSSAERAADRAQAARLSAEALTLCTAAGNDAPAGQIATIGLTAAGYAAAIDDWDGAISAYQVTLPRLGDTDPRRAAALHGLGQAYWLRAGRRGAQPATAGTLKQDSTQAEDALRSALDAVQALHGHETLAAEIHVTLGEVYRAQQRQAEALEQAVAAAELADRSSDDALHVRAHRNHILTLLDAGRLSEADEACAAFTKEEQAADPYALLTLAQVAAARGQSDQADIHFSVAREAASRSGALDADESLWFQLVTGQAACATARGDWRSAERLLRDALADPEVSRAPLTQAALEYRLGQLCLTTGRLDDAKKSLRAAHERQVELLGADHPDSLQTAVELALVAREQARYRDAEEQLKAATAGLARSLGESHPAVADARFQLATVLLERGRFGEALAEALRASQIYDERFGPQHPDAVRMCVRAALVAARCGTEVSASRFSELNNVALRRFQALREKLGDADPRAVELLVDIADINARSPASYEAALKAYGDAAELYGQRGFDRCHPELQKLRLGQARLLVVMGRVDEADRMFQQALSCQSTLEHDAQRAWLLEGLGDIRRTRGDADRARSAYLEAYQILREIYGSEHPAVKAFEERLR